MRYETGAALRRAIDTQFAKRGENKQRFLHAIARERLLARVNACEPSIPIILKGGTAMEIRLGMRARSTVDIDFGAANVDAAAEFLSRAVGIDLDDHFNFSVAERGQPQSEVFRAKIAVTLGGRRFGPTRFAVDIGHSMDSPIERRTLESQLAFAGVSPLEISLIAAEEHYAEKFHGATLPRKSGLNTRAKDLFDMVVMQEELSLDTDRITKALKRVFSMRRTHDLPDIVPTFPTEWAPALIRMSQDEDRPLPLPDAQRAVSAFLNPILARFGTTEKGLAGG